MKKICLFLVVFFAISWLFLAKLPRLTPVLDSANLIIASDTLNNSRLSYRAGISSGLLGSSTITIDSSGNADNNTNNLFPGDIVCFTNINLNGCTGDITYTVSKIIDPITFEVSSPLTNNLETDGYVVSPQYSIHNIVFTLSSTVPSNGNILITIPAVQSANKTNDGFPDTANSISSNGFDICTLTTENISVSSLGCNNNWSVANVTAGNGNTNHTIRIDRTIDSCVANSIITVTIGDNNKQLINPAPLSISHEQGFADIYSINVKTRDGSGNTIDFVFVRVAPVEGVLVSATVDESLSFAVMGIAANSGTYCNVSRTPESPDSTAYTIPWGKASSTYEAATHNAVQQLIVSTNASSGYDVYIEENDQMGRDGNICTGATPSTGNYMFGSGVCIRDTTCGTIPCTHTTPTNWSDMVTYPGFGYSLDHQSGNDSKFNWNDSGTWLAKQIADQEALESKTDIGAEIMTNAGPVLGSSVYVCYRISIPNDQPAGYYYNKIIYTAVPKF